MDDILSRLIEVAQCLAEAKGEAFHVIETFLGNRTVISDSELQRFYMGYPNEFLFSTTTKEQQTA